MESIGNDERIRALFSEVKLADEQTVPSFTATWHRAQSHSLRRPRGAFKLAFAAATALLVFAFASLFLWARFSTPSGALHVASAKLPAVSGLTPTQLGRLFEDVRAAVPGKNVHAPIKTRSLKFEPEPALVAAANRKALQNAQQIASWQSPTASLLSSSSDQLIKSLPQLNENANELKSSLPNRQNEKEK